MRSKHNSTTRGWQTPQPRLLLASSDSSQQLYNPVLSFALSSFSTALSFRPSTPSQILRCWALRLSLCVPLALTGACFGPWREWSAPWHRHFWVDKHTQWTMHVCRTTRSPFAVRLLDVCWGVWVSVGSSPAQVETNVWQTHTRLSLFVSFWTGFLWASFPLLMNYCTAANLSTSVKH